MTDIYGWLQLALFIGFLALLTKPVGLYLVRVLDLAGGTFLDPVIKPPERLLCGLLGIDPQQGTLLGYWGSHGSTFLALNMDLDGKQ